MSVDNVARFDLFFFFSFFFRQDCTQAVREIFSEGETNLGLVCEEILDMVSADMTAHVAFVLSIFLFE